MDALAIARRSHLILATGWTPKQLDAQDALELARLEAYLQVKAGLEAEARDKS
jgi:hypothetical protein